MKKKTSKNDKAGEICGFRDTSKQPIDFPCEVGFHCPVCKYEMINEAGQWDERLYWSEYKYFLYCYTCNKDYPSVLCKESLDKATDCFLDIVKEINTFKLNQN